MMRLNKYLAHCGVGSRRKVEELIVGGAVEVNGQPVEGLGSSVDETSDVVKVNGRKVTLPDRFQYFIINKPVGYVVTRKVSANYRRAYDLLPEETHRSVDAVGRLDRDSGGLLLFTNNGDLAHRLAHPRYGCKKLYELEVRGEIGGNDVQHLLNGVKLGDGKAKAESVEVHHVEKNGNSWIGIEMSEGRKHIVRRMCATIGHPVVKLTRTRMGPLELGTLNPGKARHLTPGEIKQIYENVDMTPPVEKDPRRRSRETPAAYKLRPSAKKAAKKSSKKASPRAAKPGRPPAKPRKKP